MSETETQTETPRTSTNPIIIVLVVAVVVLAAGLGYMVWKGSSNDAVTEIPASSPTLQGNAQQPAATGSDSSASSAMGGATGAASGEVPGDFDPATGTQVPAGTTPEQWVNAYYDAAGKGDWETAFNHLPAAKQAGSSPDALKQQVEGYDVTGFTVVSANEEGDKATVVVDQQTGQYGTFVNTWVFVKNNGEWVVASKAVTGMK